MKLHEILHDETDSPSTKRVIAFIGVLTLCTALVLNTIYPKAVAPSPVIVDAIKFIIMTCIAGTSIDKFSPKPAPTLPTPVVKVDVDVNNTDK